MWMAEILTINSLNDSGCLISLSSSIFHFQNHDKLGRVVCTPTMINAPYQLESGTHLQWYPISGVKKSKGELLAAFELYEV